jgi:hypothetical protein
VIGDEKFGPTDEEFDPTVERARMLNPSSSAAMVIPLRPSNAELDAEVVRLDSQAEAAAASEPEGVTLDDFVAYMPAHSYIYTLTREMWPAPSVNARIPPVLLVDDDGKPILDNKGNRQYRAANAWLDKNRAVEQMTWAPGEPMQIEGRLVANGGWLRRDGVVCFNLYRAPTIEPGDAKAARPWLDHIHKVFENDANHIITWLAHRKQKPQEKINHALVLGGLQGIGKDTLLEPVKYAVGPWNFNEVSPNQIAGRFNGFLKSVILRVNEARDLGEGNRFQFYDHMKAYTAAPPDVLRVDEKHLRECNEATEISADLAPASLNSRTLALTLLFAFNREALARDPLKPAET